MQIATTCQHKRVSINYFGGGDICIDCDQELMSDDNRPKTTAEQFEDRVIATGTSYTLTPCATCQKKLTIREYRFAQKLDKPLCYSCQRL